MGRRDSWAWASDTTQALIAIPVAIGLLGLVVGLVAGIIVWVRERSELAILLVLAGCIQYRRLQCASDALGEKDALGKALPFGERRGNLR